MAGVPEVLCVVGHDCGLPIFRSGALETLSGLFWLCPCSNQARTPLLGATPAPASCLEPKGNKQPSPGLATRPALLGSHMPHRTQGVCLGWVGTNCREDRRGYGTAGTQGWGRAEARGWVGSGRRRDLENHAAEEGGPSTQDPGQSPEHLQNLEMVWWEEMR